MPFLTVREIRPAQEARMAILRQLERRLTDGEITPMEFIDANLHSADGVIERVLETRRQRDQEMGPNETSSEDDSENEIIEDDIVEHPNNVNDNGNLVHPDSMCKSCGQGCVEKYLLGPCGHNPFCNNCLANEICSVCDQNVAIRIKMN